jgi:hypothetical protein
VSKPPEKKIKYTVRKAKRDAGPQHKGDGKFRYSYRKRDPISGVDGFFN